jgi:hypothetical protein
LRRIAKALDAVLGAVAAEELCLDVCEGVTLVVDNEEKGKRHYEVSFTLQRGDGRSPAPA